MRRVPDAVRLKILIDYANGDQVRPIAIRYGVSSSFPCVFARKVGIRRNATEEECRQALAEFIQRSSMPKEEDPPDPQEMGPDLAVVSEIRRLAAKGVARTAIAALLRCNNRDVANALD